MPICLETEKTQLVNPLLPSERLPDAETPEERSGKRLSSPPVQAGAGK